METEQNESMDIDKETGPASPGSLKKKQLSNGTDHPDTENGTDNPNTENGIDNPDTENGTDPVKNPCEINGDANSPKNSKVDAVDTLDNIKGDSQNENVIVSDEKNSDKIKNTDSVEELPKSGSKTPDESDDSEKMDTDSDLKTIELSDTELNKDDDSGNATPNVRESETEDGKESEKVEVEKIEDIMSVEKTGLDLTEKENEDSKDSDKDVKSVSSSSGTDKSNKSAVRDDDNDIEIVGESKVVNMNKPHILGSSQNVVFVPNNPVSKSLSSLSLLQQGLSATSLINLRGQRPGIFTGQSGIGTLSPGMVLNSTGLSSQVTPTVAPPKPKSSLDQIELIRWEIHNRVNTRPKYFKPSPSSELGSLAKFLFDIGSDLTKESVYHELVKIQSKKNDDDKLSDKEKEDLQKLKDIEQDLQATIGHLKFKMKKRCRACNFQTESMNVMHFHKQFPHEDGKVLNCAHCKYSVKQPMSFKFHMESEHNIQPRLQDKKAFFECDMCPYENNSDQKVVQHKQRCIKQFRPHFNLHPSCLSGAEINLCLENIFYKPVIPKNLKLLQQKHAQQQAALAEARRQQAQVQALAAQKNAAATFKKQQMQKQQEQLLKLKQLQKLQRPPLPNNLRSIAPANSKVPFSPLPPVVNPVEQIVRPKNSRPTTVASMLNNRQSITPSQRTGPHPQSSPMQPANNVQGSPKAFEVCELCGGYVKDRKALRIHFFYAHRIDLPFNLFERHLAPLYCATCYIRFWTAQGLRKHIDTHKEENQTTGVVGKCISCGHHVLNLLLHMRIVHNRELQHYINARMCMFCPTNFGSKDEVEQHIKMVHGNIDPKTGVIKAVPNASSSQKQASKRSKGSSNTPAVKGSVCVLCNLNFGRNVDLTRHCMKMHHTCMKCGMVVIDKPSLLKHSCLSSPSGTRDCNMCDEIGFHPAYFVKHLRDKHLKKFSIKINRLSRKTIEQWTKKPFKDQERIVEISDSSDDENVDKPTVTTPMTKKPRMGPASVMKKYRLEGEKVSDSDVVNIDDVDDSEKSNGGASDEQVNTQEKEAPSEEVNSSTSSSGRKRKSANPMSLTSKRQRSS